MTRALLGLAAAAVGFPWVFRSRWGGFWTRMALVAGALGLFAAWGRDEGRPARPSPVDTAVGLASAAGLYEVFQVGDRLARAVRPAGSTEIARIYQLRSAAPRWVIALLLAGIIAPSEELFWRGLVQRQLMDRFGTWPGALIAAACYGGVHLGSGNLTLSAAATVAGAYWSAQYALRRRLPALVVSHVVWDLWIFLVAPTTGGRSKEPGS